MHRGLSPTTSWCRRISNGCTSSSLRQRASQKSLTICESWSRRSGRSWCTSCRQGCRSPVDLLLLAADESRADDCSPNCCRPKADEYGRGKEANRKQQFATPWYVSAIPVGGLPYASGHGAHFIRRLLLLLCRCSGGEGRNFPIEDAWRKDLIGVLPDDGVAFAGDVLDRRAIEDLDVAAAVADQARALQQAGRDGHRGAAHAEHLPEKLLR